MSMKKTYNELSIASNPLNIDSAIELGSLDSSSAQHLDQVEQCSEHLAVNTSALGADRLDLSTNTASRFSCFLNLANTILGSGMLGMPYAIANTGWLFGSVLTLLCGYFSSLALHSLAMCALEVPGDSSFFSVANNVMPTLSSLIDLAVALKCFGVATSYLIVMGDLMPEVMEQFGGSSLSQSRELWVLVGFGIVAPLSYLRSLDSLKFTSFLSLGFVFFLAALVVFYSSGVDGLDPCRHAGADCEGPTRPVEASLETLRILPIFIFGFTCQQNIFAVVNELQDPTPRRVDSVIMSSIGCALAVYLVVACCGYFTYGSKLQSDILLNYPGACCARVGRSCVALLSISLIIPARYLLCVARRDLPDERGQAPRVPAGGVLLPAAGAPRPQVHPDAGRQASGPRVPGRRARRGLGG